MQIKGKVVINKERLSGLAFALETKRGEKCFKNEMRKICVTCPIAVTEIQVNMTSQKEAQDVKQYVFVYLT